MSWHRAIIGMTGSGKTTLAQALARKHRRAGHGVLVFDPRRSAGWDADWKTTDFSLFLAKANASRRCALFVEDVGGVGRKKEFEWLFTDARHLGHATTYLSQYHAQVPPIVRTNVQTVCLFLVSSRSAKVWADEFARPEIEPLNAQCGKFQFVRADRYGVPRIQSLKL